MSNLQFNQTAYDEAGLVYMGAQAMWGVRYSLTVNQIRETHSPFELDFFLHTQSVMPYMFQYPHS